MNQLTLLNTDHFPANAPRLEAHIFMDKEVIIENEYFSLSVLLVDPFNKSALY